MKAYLLFSFTVYCVQCIGLAHKFADRVIRLPWSYSSIWLGRCFSLCHWEPSRVYSDDGACSLYDRITLPVNYCYIHNGYFMYINNFLIFFPPLYDNFSIYIYFLVTLWVPSVTCYAFFDGIHISHTYCVKIIFAIVNYFLYYVRDENK